jgi:hypothetical protein
MQGRTLRKLSVEAIHLTGGTSRINLENLIFFPFKSEEILLNFGN